MDFRVNDTNKRTYYYYCHRLFNNIRKTRGRAFPIQFISSIVIFIATLSPRSDRLRRKFQYNDSKIIKITIKTIELYQFKFSGSSVPDIVSYHFWNVNFVIHFRYSINNTGYFNFYDTSPMSAMYHAVSTLLPE